MNNIACFPGKYIQGSGAILKLESIINQFGSKAVVLTSKSAQKHLPVNFSQLPLSSSLCIEIFKGECCEAALENLAHTIKKSKADVMVGMGGGKVIDTAKIAADRAGIPVIIVPTIASTDAPCSGCAVTYTPEGIFEKVHYQRLNPSVVLVDVDIIAQAPLRFLIAGMGDALATWFEARSCSTTSAVNECGGLSTLAGLNIARLCYDTLLTYGLRAKLEHESGEVNSALNHIIEANILLSGIGFESGGLAAAHAIHNGLTAVPETHSFYHGEKVAFGLLAGLHMNAATSEELHEVYGFCVSVGLPICFSDIGLANITHEKLMQIAQKSVETGSSIHHEAGEIRAERVYDALIKADAFGRHFILKSQKHHG